MTLDALNTSRVSLEVHINTWFTLSGSEIIRTRCGTRPGSPLADIIFHVLMTSVRTDIEEWIGQQTSLRSIMQEAGISPVTIIWSDDVAIPWAAHHPQQLIDELQLLIAQVDHQFTRRGLELHFGQCKTNVVLTFTGPGASDFCRQFLLCDSPGLHCTMTDARDQWVPITPTYKHLGVMFSSEHDLTVELRHRKGQAKHAFTQLSKPELCNRHLPLSTRVRLSRPW